MCLARRSPVAQSVSVLRNTDCARTRTKPVSADPISSWGPCVWWRCLARSATTKISSMPKTHNVCLVPTAVPVPPTCSGSLKYAPDAMPLPWLIARSRIQRCCLHGRKYLNGILVRMPLRTTLVFDCRRYRYEHHSTHTLSPL